jgi:hypothetical protein
MNSSLFDETVNGLHTYGKSTVGDAWKVENGTLHFDPTTKENNKEEI